MSLRLQVPLVAVVLFFAAPALVHAQSQQPGFYDRKAEGWFWYRKEPEQPKAPKPKPKPPVLSQTPQQAPEPAKAAPAPPQALSAEWVRTNLPKYKDQAWDNPTVENVKAYLYLQRFAMDRSEQFSDATELAVVGDPFLDELSRRPVATFATQKLDGTAGRAKNQILSAIAERAGLFFFFKSDDQFSQLQAPIVKMLERSQGFAVVPVSVDGAALPDGSFPEFRVDKGQAERLGIVNYPAVFLASPEGKFAPIGQGTMSLPDMRHRILVAAKREGWVTEKEFNSTRPVQNLENNVAVLVASPEDAASLSQLVKGSGDDGGFVPPDQLVRYMQSKLKEN